jgi:hypothetical protein
MDNACNHCNALHFKGENINCCHSGKVDLPPLAPYPAEFRAMLTSNDADSKHFLDSIRQYNSSMTFASFMAKGMSPLQGWGPYAFRLHGQVYHRAGSLHPPDGEQRLYSQLYILEGDQAVETRMANRHNQGCRRDIMTLLTTVLDRINPFLRPLTNICLK